MVELFSVLLLFRKGLPVLPVSLLLEITLFNTVRM